MDAFCLLLKPSKKVNYLDAQSVASRALFKARSSSQVEVTLSAKFKNLEMLDKRNEDQTLLQYCLEHNILSEPIVSALNSQVDCKWKGKTPFEYGETYYSISLFI
jgi:hypothetical protein